MHNFLIAGFLFLATLSNAWAAEGQAIGTSATAPATGLAGSSTTSAIPVSATVAQLVGTYRGFIGSDKISLTLHSDGSGTASENDGRDSAAVRWRFKSDDKVLLEVIGKDGGIEKEIPFTWTEKSIVVDAGRMLVTLDKELTSP